MIDVAYLRVYRPAGEVRLPVNLGGGDVPRLGAATLTTESQVADAWEVEWNGRVWRCPRAPRRRLLESVVAYHQATTRFGVGIIDGTVAASARRELTHIRAGVGEPASVMVSAWHPPLRWFIAFDPDDHVEPMLLRAKLEDAIRRVEATADAMRRQGLPTLWVDDMVSLGSWLEAFPGHGMAELDYRQVGWRLGPTMIDDTAGDVSSSVTALAAGDLEEATRLYTTALARWVEAQAVGYSS